MKKLIFILPMLFAFAGLQGQGAMFLRGSQPAPTPGAGILDNYLGAAFAAAPDVLIYSAHSVTDNTVGSQTEGQTGQFTVLVRRDNDDALRSFTYTEVSDGTLTTWVGPANNGFVKILYDQSTNGNHATQATAASQPKIVDNGSLVVENGKAAMEFDGANDWLSVAGDFSQNGTMTAFVAALSRNVTQDGYIYDNSNNSSYGGGYSHRFHSSGGFRIWAQNAFAAATGGVTANNTLYLTSRVSTVVSATETNTLFQNGVQTATRAGGTASRDVKPTTAIGKSELLGGPFGGLILGLIAYPSDQSANRTGIETALNNYYNIY